MPENAPPGQLPRSVQVILQNDLVDSIKPGDRVEVTGVYRAAPNVHMGVTRGTFRTQIVASGVVSLLAEKQKPSLSEQDIKNIRKLAKESDVFDVLGVENSVASRMSYGGTAPVRVREQIARWKEALK